MDETELIVQLQSHLANSLSEAVRTKSLEEERPLPAIILEDWTTEDFNFNNSPIAHHSSTVNDNGSITVEKVYRFHYQTRLEFIARADDEVEASRLKDKLKTEIRLLRVNPKSLHGDVREVKPIDSGDPENYFVEPKETEFHLSARIKSFHDIVKNSDDDGDWDVLEEIHNSFSLEGTEVHSGVVQ